MKSPLKKKKSNVALRRTINFLAEAGQLKRVKRSGWWVAGICNPESVAEHSFRCAVLGYILAQMEKADPYQVILMALFNDIHEARINDLHKIGHRYIDFSRAEESAFREQLSLLPGILRVELKTLREQYVAQKSKEALVARDADILECIIQAKEYLDCGLMQARSFMTVGARYLRTKSARLIYRSLRKWSYGEWWKHLKKFER